jgi:uncharacterized protein (DUF1778 family)
MSLSTGLVSSTANRAKEVVTGHEALTLTSRDWKAFLAALDADRPRPRLAAYAQGRRRQRDAG